MAAVFLLNGTQQFQLHVADWGWIHGMCLATRSSAGAGQDPSVLVLVLRAAPGAPWLAGAVLLCDAAARGAEPGTGH